MNFRTSYMECVYNDPEKYAKLIKKVAKKVRELQESLGFHAIAFRGTSGAAMAYPVSAATGIPLICVRKDDSHHGGMTEGSDNIDVKKYLIIDDFIGLGRTMDAIIKAIDDRRGRKVVKCVGILLYNPDYLTDRESYANAPVISMYKSS